MRKRRLLLRRHGRLATISLVSALVGIPAALAHTGTAQASVTTIPRSDTLIAAGRYHSVVLEPTGVVWVYGGNGDNALGVFPHTGMEPAPTQIQGLGNIRSVSVGYWHSLALRKDGTVWAWGDNGYGQLGNGTFGWSPAVQAPNQVLGLTGVVAIAAGQYHSMALKADGTLWVWGSDFSGQLGDGNPGTYVNTPQQVPGLTNVTAIAGGGAFSMALTADGTLWSWGDNYDGELGNGSLSTNNCSCVATPAPVPGLPALLAISTGGNHTVAVDTNGGVWAWGLNSSGQLGDGTTNGTATPQAVPGLSGVSTVAAGDEYSMALKSDGTVSTWGADYAGQLGDGGLAQQDRPVAINVGRSVTALAAGNSHAIARASDGTVLGWGDDSSGQLGDNGPPTNSCQCQTTAVVALFPSVPTQPINVIEAAPSAGAMGVTWLPPNADGGAFVSSYTVTLTPGNMTQSVGALHSWAVGGATTPQRTRSTVHGGSFSTLLGATTGAVPYGDSWLSQAIAVPTGSPVLSFWYYPQTGGSYPYVSQQMQVRDTSGNTLATVLATASNASAWTNVTFDMTPYAGSTVVLWFDAFEDGQSGDLTSMYVDDVSVTAGGTTNAVGNAGFEDAPSVTFTGLTNGSYTASVVATNGIGSGPAGVSGSALVGAPSQPLNLTATPGNGQASFGWTTPASDGGSPIVGYTLTCTPPSGPASTMSLDVVTFATMTGLANGTTYSCAVAASNQVGTGAFSSPVSAMPDVTYPPARQIVFVHGINGNFRDIANQQPHNWENLIRPLAEGFGAANVHYFPYYQDMGYEDPTTQSCVQPAPDTSTGFLVTDPNSIDPTICDSKGALAYSATGLDDFVAQYAGPTAVVANSMGGAITRGWMALVQGGSQGRGLHTVDTVVFVQGAQQGSWIGAAGEDAQNGIGFEAPITGIVARWITGHFGFDPTRPGIVDVASGSAWYDSVNLVGVPASLNYYNFYTSISADFKASLLWWSYTSPSLDLGDIVMRTGTGNPTDHAALGGARFLPSGSVDNHREFAVSKSYDFTPSDLASGLLGVVDGSLNIFQDPANHFNYGDNVNDGQILVGSCLPSSYGPSWVTPTQKIVDLLSDPANGCTQ